MVLMLVAAVNGGPCSAQRTSANDRLVWSIRVEEAMAHLEVNLFGSSRPFPKDHLRIMRVVDMSQHDGERLALDMRLEVAPLYVNADGTLEGGGRAALEFFPGGRVSQGSVGGAFTVLTLPGEEAGVARIPVRYVNLLDLPNQEVLGWELLSPDGLAMVRTPQRTFYFEAGISEPPGSYPFPIYLRPTHSVVVSTGSGSFAAVATEDVQGTHPAGSAREMLTVFNPAGEIILETDPARFSYDQLYLTPSGETLVFRRASQQGGDETIALDVESGRSSSVTIENGIRYYSGDGTRMVVVQAGLGAATYYDVTDPFNPTELGGYQADDFIITAAVCDDGSLLALQILNSEANLTRTTKRVVVLDEAMREVDYPITASQQVDMSGLQWEGEYLLVGTQQHPLPVPVSYRTTERISVYDYSQQGRRP